MTPSFPLRQLIVLPDDVELLARLAAVLAALQADPVQEVCLEAGRVSEAYSAAGSTSKSWQDEDRRREALEADMHFIPEELERCCGPAEPHDLRRFVHGLLQSK